MTTTPSAASAAPTPIACGSSMSHPAASMTQSSSDGGGFTTFAEGQQWIESHANPHTAFANTPAFWTDFMNLFILSMSSQLLHKYYVNNPDFVQFMLGMEFFPDVQVCLPSCRL
jgi:hypothetical protein